MPKSGVSSSTVNQTDSKYAAKVLKIIENLFTFLILTHSASSSLSVLFPFINIQLKNCSKKIDYLLDYSEINFLFCLIDSN